MKSFQDRLYKSLDKDIQDTAKEKLKILKDYLKHPKKIELEENMFSNDLIILMKEIVNIPKAPKLPRSAKEYLGLFLERKLNTLFTLTILNAYCSCDASIIFKAWDELNDIHIDSLGLKLKEEIFER